MKRVTWIWLFLSLLLSARVASAAAPTDCDTPRNAADSVFGWLQPSSFEPEKAALCLDPAGRSRADLAKIAQHIKTIYDARALLVDMSTLSDAPDWTSPATGRQEIAPHPGLPDVVIARQGDGKWRWTRESLDRIEDLYDASYGALDDALVSHLPESFRGKVFGVQVWQYLAIFLIFILALVLRKVIQVVVTSRVRHLVENMGQAWAARLVDVFASPGATLLTAIMLRVAYPVLRLPIRAAQVMSVGVRVLVVLSLVWATYRLVDVFADRLAHKAEATESKLDDQLVPLVRKSLKIFTVAAGVLFILQNLSVNVGSLLAGLGIGGLAVALAAKDTLANFFGSVMIFLDRPFQIGDWVALGGVEGVVEEVGFRSTRIRTFYNSLVTVPNAKFTEANIDNLGVREFRRTNFTVNLTYDTTPEQMEAFVEGVRAVLQANPHTRKDYYEVHMSGFGASSLDVMVYFFLKVPGWSDELREKHNVLLEIMRLARDVGVHFAFPTQTLHVAEVAEPGAERRLPEPLSADKLARVIDGFAKDGERSKPATPLLTSGYYAGNEPSIHRNEESGS